MTKTKTRKKTKTKKKTITITITIVIGCLAKYQPLYQGPDIDGADGCFKRKKTKTMTETKTIAIMMFDILLKIWEYFVVHP